MMVTTTAWLGAAILIAAGLWQLTPIKHACLRHCRSPVGFLRHTGALAAGARSAWDWSTAPIAWDAAGS